MLPGWVAGLQTHLGFENYFAVKDLKKTRDDEDGVAGEGERVLARVIDDVWSVWHEEEGRGGC